MEAIIKFSGHIWSKINLRSSAVPVLILYFASGFSTTLGSAVIVGWYTETVLLIQIHPSFVPMQFNTAMGFLLCGLGLFFHLRQKHWAVLFCSISVGLIASMTLFEYLFDVNVGIDELFMDHYITVETSHPGRMAPNTALCFLLTSLGMLLILGNNIGAYKSFCVTVLGSLVTSLGSIAFVGYVGGLETAYGWAHLTRMALHTSLGMIGLGAGLLLAVFSLKKLNQNLKFMFLTFIVTAMVVGLWAVSNQASNAHANDILQDVAFNVRIFFEKQLGTEIQSLERMADRWQARSGTPIKELQQDAGLYLRHQTGLKGIFLFDKEKKLLWNNHKSLLGMILTETDQADSNREQEAAASLIVPQAVKSTHLRTFISNDLFSSGAEKASLVLVEVPLFKGEMYDGALICVLNLEDFARESVSQHILDRISIVMHDGGELLMRLDPTDGVIIEDLAITDDVVLYDAVWNFAVNPTDKMMDEISSPLPIIVLIIGCAAFIFFFFTDRTRIITASNRKLAAVNTELEQFVYVASHDLKAPMRGINQLANWISQDIDDTARPQTKRYLKQMSGRVARLEKLLDSLLAYSRSGREDLVIETFDAGVFLQDIIALIAPREGMHIHIMGNMPVLTTDKTVFQQVMQNLISNAIKHHDKQNGSVVITYEPTKEYHHFMIKDDGPGIPQEFHSQIFDMFRTLKPRDEVEGSGMGLALVKKTIVSLRGDVTVVSDPSIRRGTVFNVFWPKEMRHDT